MEKKKIAKSFIIPQKRKTVVFQFTMNFLKNLSEEEKEEAHEYYFSLEEAIHDKIIHTSQHLHHYIPCVGHWFVVAKRLRAWKQGITPTELINMSLQECEKVMGITRPLKSDVDLEMSVSIKKQAAAAAAAADLPELKDILGLKELRRAVICPKCKSKNHMVDGIGFALRKADEGDTSYYQCYNPVCKHTWKES